MKKHDNITHWCLAQAFPGYILVGRIERFDGIRDAGTNDTSSLLVKIDFKKKIAETLNTIYHLE